MPQMLITDNLKERSSLAPLQKIYSPVAEYYKQGCWKGL